jgi:lipopolysaccharide export LptBFGC system permease protein LptF
MRSKTILATVVAAALGAPLTALADSDSYGTKSPSAGASVNSGTSAQGSYGQDRNDRYAQNDDRDNGKHRGRAKHRDKDDRASARSQDDAQYGSRSGNDQYAQNQGSQYPGQGSSSGSRY